MSECVWCGVDHSKENPLCEEARVSNAKKRFIAMEQLKKLALDRYEEGGRWFVECWEDKDWLEFIDACDRYWRPYDVCLLEMMEAKTSCAGVFKMPKEEEKMRTYLVLLVHNEGLQYEEVLKGRNFEDALREALIRDETVLGCMAEMEDQEEEDFEAFLSRKLKWVAESEVNGDSDYQVIVFDVTNGVPVRIYPEG